VRGARGGTREAGEEVGEEGWDLRAKGRLTEAGDETAAMTVKGAARTRIERKRRRGSMGKGVGNGGGEGEVEFTREKEGRHLSRVHSEGERVSFAGGGKSAGAIVHDDDGRIFFCFFEKR
jgi:hypothetical protein